MPTKVILLSWTSLRVNKSISREKKIKKGSNTGRQVLGKFISREGSYRCWKKILLAKYHFFSHDFTKRTERKQK